jgi:hypothetical protein
MHAGGLAIVITVHIGMSGAGKTYALRAEVYRHLLDHGRSAIIVDQMAEWSTAPPNLSTGLVANVEEARSALAEGLRCAVIRLPTDPYVAVEESCRWALDNAATVVVPEAQLVAPPSILGPNMKTMVCAWRHHDAALYVDTQRISLLNRTIVDLARMVRVFAVAGDRDHSVLRDLGGRELSDAAYECAERLERGEPGWHVPLGIRRRGPYELVKYA